MLRRTMLGAVVFLAWVGVASAITMPADFVAENAAPGAVFDTPTGIAFAPDGRILVAEKRGRVYAIKNGVKNPTPLWSAEIEVLNVNDRGLLDVAVDPNYLTNHFVYMLYTVDPDSNGSDDNIFAFGRLTRYQVSFSDPNALVPGSRTVLFGQTWGQGPCSGSQSHTVGSLRWGTDGSLLVSAGEGASYDEVDDGGLHPGMFGPGHTDPNEDIGAFRAQYTGSLAGKVLRIDPSNGQGYASNPYYNGNLNSPQSKVYAYGFRNPFRFCVEPGSGSVNPAAGNPGVLYISDVGWNNWEEISAATAPGQNFGWPCYEGPEALSGYQNASPAHNGCGTYGTSTNPATPRAPVTYWNHWNEFLSDPEPLKGRAGVAGAVYSGTRYPAEYRNQLFFCDFTEGFIKRLVTDQNHNLVEVIDFAEGAEGPVDLQSHPTSGDLYYVSIYDGTVMRIRYAGSASNNPPVAIANGSPLTGAAPLTVDFSSAGSGDPDDDPITTDWSFGDLNGSGEANPQHTYISPGSFAAVLTVEDGRGGLTRDTVHVTVTGTPTGFPTTGILDNFDRPNGPIGAGWTGFTGGLAISNNQLTLAGADGWAVWTGAVFGPWQEAYFTLDQTTAGAPEHDLMLKIQGTSWSDGEIEVRYDAVAGEIVTSTYDPAGGWQARGTIPATLAAGDQFGARADAGGNVQVFINGALVGESSAAGWPFVAQGGRIGFTLVGADQSRLNNYGGGDATVASNTPPHAIVVLPANGSFFVTGDNIQLSGDANDAQQAAADLLYHWRVDLHHNLHTHVSSYVADTRTASFVSLNHDDGTGIWYEILLQVTDAGGLADTARVNLYPEVDLEPSAVTVTPPSPGSQAPAQYQFVIRNRGRMLASPSHWVLRADGMQLAAGDTLVAALDSVTIQRTVPPLLSAGDHTLRIVVDSLAAIHETNEANNARTQTLSVLSLLDAGTGIVHAASVSRPYPNPTTGPVAFALALPHQARVDFTIHDLQGREVWRSSARTWSAGTWTLQWPGISNDGRRAHPGVYLARVMIDGQPFTRRIALMK